MRVLQRLWYEDAGWGYTTEVIISLTMVICALVVGYQSLRVAIVTEMADIAEAIGALDQSYSFSGFTGHSSACAGSNFDDLQDFCDEATACAQVGNFSRCVVLVNPNKEANAQQGGNTPANP